MRVKTWNNEEYFKKAENLIKEEKVKNEHDVKELKKRKRMERDPLHQGLIVERAKLKARQFDLNLKVPLGKTQIIGNTTSLSQQAGFYCSVCECVLKDSVTYLDHINGKWHMRALGMSMRVEKVGADRVRMRIEFHKRNQEATKMLKTKNQIEVFEECVQLSEHKTENKTINTHTGPLI
jgi:U4/U6.U5 tri-snRNP component SNU23